MSKIRTVKPELFRHEQLFEAEQHSGFPLRLIYIGLFTVADAEGRFRWRPRQLKLDILPYDDINFGAALSALAECGFVQRYEYEGDSYGVIPTWRKHQAINQREPDSVLPDPRHCGAGLMRSGQPAPVYVAPMRRAERSALTSATGRAAEKCTQIPLDDQAVDGLFSQPAAQTGDLGLDKKPAADTPLLSQTMPRSGPVMSTPSQVIPPPDTAMPLQDTVSRMQSTVTPMQSPVMHVQDNAMQRQSLALQSPASLEMEMEMEEEVELEKEREGKWKRQHPHARAVPDPVVSVFEHWQRVMAHPKAVLDKSRRRFIQSALKQGYRVADLCQAITGCSLTPHNRGQNDRGERYDGLQLILRSADQIDRFMRNAQHPPRSLNKAEQRLQSNTQAAQDWLQQSAAEEQVDGQHG